MSVFETDYSNLFAAGLRVIQSRRTGRRSSPESALNPAAVSSLMSTSEHNHDHTPSTGSSSSWKTFHFPTRLWRRPSPRKNKASSADASSSLTPTNTRDAKPKPTRRRSRSMPGDVAEESTSALDVRIWDWTTRVSNAATIFGEEDEDECVDPYLDKVKPPSPDSLWEPEFRPLHPPPSWRRRRRACRMSVQTLPVHLQLPTHSYCSFFDLDLEEDETVWESASDSSSSSDDESGPDDDWHQFRVEWIDFDSAL